MAAEQTVELPKLELPPLPSPQPGDSEQVTTTVGAMRNALYYYELTPLLIEHSNELAQIAFDTAATADELRLELIEEKQKKEQWRRWSIIFGVSATVFFTLDVIMLVW